MVSIVRDDAVRSGDPRIDGTRVTVIDVKRRVIDNDEDPHVVAGQYELAMGELFSALTYYYEHRDELRKREREADAARHEGEQRTRELLNHAESGETNTGEQAD